MGKLMKSNRRVVVIGGGFGGIAAALRLRRKGHQVTLLERNSVLGGRGRIWQHEGFTFDAGPTVLTAPVLFEELFQLFGERLEDHVKLLPVAPWYQYRFHDGAHLNYGPTKGHTIAEVERISPHD